MAQIQTTEIFADGQTVNAARLNNVIVAASALAGIISEQGALVTPADTDQVLLFRPGTPGTLKRANVAGLPSGITDVNATASPAFINLVATTPSTGVRLLTLSFDQQQQNKVLAAPADGTLGAPSFRALTPADLPVATVNIAALTINWSLGNVFSKGITGPGPTHLVFSNPTEGQSITVLISQTSTPGLVTFPTGTSGVYWAGATEYVATNTAGRHDILIFRYISSHYYGNYFLNFQSV